jgi:predicted sulfurtransferase
MFVRYNGKIQEMDVQTYLNLKKDGANIQPAGWSEALQDNKKVAPVSYKNADIQK